MVHDWIFVARHCLNDDRPEPSHKPYADMTFQESANIIGEAIKTLIDSGKVDENQVAPRVIAGVVAGPISYDRWIAKNECLDERVSEQHRAEVDAFLARKQGDFSPRFDKAADGRTRRTPPATFVAEISF